MNGWTVYSCYNKSNSEVTRSVVLLHRCGINAVGVISLFNATLFQVSVIKSPVKHQPRSDPYNKVSHERHPFL